MKRTPNRARNGRGWLPAMLMAVLLPMVGCDRHAGHDHDHDDSHGHGDHHAAHHDEEERPKGPHGGRLLEDGGFRLELAIEEAGMRSRFRAYVSDGGRPVDPASVRLEAKLRRLGGRGDTITFKAGDGFLEGEQAVYEPHSFSAKVSAVHDGKTHQWEFESEEARTVIKPEAADRAGIRVETAGGARIRVTATLPGEVRYNEERTAAVPARFDGRVVEVRRSVGERVKAGEMLAVIESRALADARADYVDSVHRLELAQAVFIREERLREKQVGAEQDYLKARHEMEEAEIHKQTARQKLLALGVPAEELGRLAREPDGKVEIFKVRQPFADGALSRFNLVAPLDGTVIARDVAVGRTVRADEVLFQVADLSSVWVDLTLFPSQKVNPTPGRKVVVRSGPQRIEGEIGYVSPFVGGLARAGTVRARLPNVEGVWRPGQFVEGDVLVDETEVPVAVKASALQTFKEWRVVFVNEGDQYEPVVVETGRHDGEWVEITSGLKPGLRYVADGSYVVKADILKAGAAHDHDH